MGLGSSCEGRVSRLKAVLGAELPSWPSMQKVQRAVRLYFEELSECVRDFYALEGGGSGGSWCLPCVEKLMEEHATISHFNPRQGTS